jgi:hypothetical protein
LAKDDFTVCGDSFPGSDNEAIADTKFVDRASTFEPVGIDHPHVLGTDGGERAEGISRTLPGPGLEIPTRQQKRRDAGRNVEYDIAGVRFRPREAVCPWPGYSFANEASPSW